MKKRFWIIPSVVVILAGGAWAGERMVKQALANQVLKEITQPSVQTAVNQYLANSVGNSVSLGNLTGAINNGTSIDATGQTQNSSDGGRSGETSGQAPRTASTASTTPSTGVSQAKSSQTSGSGGSSKSASESIGNNSESTSSSSPATTSSSTVPVFTTKAQAEQYALSKFTPKEIRHYMSLYADRGSLTEAQKNQIKQQILSHFTPAEIQALEKAVHQSN